MSEAELGLANKEKENYKWTQPEENSNSKVNHTSKNKIHPLAIEENGVEKTEKPEENRDNWTGKLDFFLSALSYCVGLGAVWRFPYLCYKNGGGAFLIPFFIFLIFVGIPIMFLELAVGQFMSRGPVLSWVMVPLFKGVGISMNLINNYVNIYYIMIIAYSLYYLVLSLNSRLPWDKCNPKWASENCVDDFDSKVFTFAADCEIENKKFPCGNGQCYEILTSSGIQITEDNCRSNLTASLGYWNPNFPSQDYWNNFILKTSKNDMNNTDTLVWQLVLALFIAWIVCFFCLFRGVKLSGKINYFTAIFPYLVLFILGIRGWILDGAEIGIRYYIIPEWSKLAEASVWTDAAVQVFFTLSLSYGGMVTLSSYNKYNHNILRDTLILSIVNFLTCILAGFVVFGYMGYLSKLTGLDIDKVVQSGQGLVYVVYPFAATTLAASPLWSVMFFVMMLALGMGTMIASVETLTTSLEDFFPALKRTPKIKAFTLAIICFIYFLAGLLLCSRTGTYWIELLDEYSANWSILMIAIIECVSVGWFYGVDRFKVDVSTMLPNSRLNDLFFVWWKICWMFLTPTLLAALIIFSWVKAELIESGSYTFPEWTQTVGQMLSASSMVGIIGWMAYEILNSTYKKKPLIDLIQTSKDWHPLLEENKQKVVEAHATASRNKYFWGLATFMGKPDKVYE